jgi:hypothetical protein
MDLEDAQMVIRIMLSADGECYVCAAELLQAFQRAFPLYAPLAADLYAVAYRGLTLDDPEESIYGPSTPAP